MMTVSEAITFWERRHYRLGKVSAIAFDLDACPKKRLKALSIMARWASPHAQMWTKLVKFTQPIPKVKSSFIPNGFAIVGEGGKEIIQMPSK